MLSILISLIILLVIFAILWWIVSLIPLPPAFPRWLISVLFALFFLIAFISLLGGAWSFPFGSGHAGMLR